MPAARQPAAALRDRAERHVFSVLPELGAVERRALALTELCDEDRETVARDLGIDHQGVGEALFRARRALRRTRAPLSAGARCERAELLLSDRLDLGLDRHARKWLEIHVARCPRCIDHEELLTRARDELRATFEATPAALPAAPQPPAIDPPAESDDIRARLRVVPPAPAEPAPPREPAEPANLKVHDVPVTHDLFAEPDTQVVVRPSPAARKAAKVIAIVLAIMAILAGIGIGLDAIRGPDHASAPWSKPTAPDIRPVPLSGQ